MNKGCVFYFTLDGFFQVVLIGMDDGLHALQLHRTPADQPLIKIDGLESTYSILGLRGLGVLVCINGKFRILFHCIHRQFFYLSGKGRDLVMLDECSLSHCLSQGFHSSCNPRASIRPLSIEGITTVTTFDLGRRSDGVYLCAATPESVILLKYSSQRGNFVQKKV
jgi:hypothetical protein